MSDEERNARIDTACGDLNAILSRLLLDEDHHIPDEELKYLSERIAVIHRVWSRFPQPRGWR